MEAKDYFDEIAECWDSEYEYHVVARNTTALVSGAASGAYILDVGCGTGEMFAPLLNAGASEITGVDLSEKMIQFAEGKIGFDPRISLHRCDILDFEEAGFDAAVMFDAYQFILDKGALIAKLHSLLRPKGRFTVAFGFGRERVNSYSMLVPDGLTAPLRPALEEKKLWERYFEVDILCDTPELYIISGTVKELTAKNRQAGDINA